MGYNKFVYNGEVKFDLTKDSITKDKLAKGVTAHGADGDEIVGTNTFDADTQDATATAAQLIDGATAYARGVKITGNIPVKGGASITISNTNAVTIPHGVYDGSGTVSISATEVAKLSANNIRDGVTLLGVKGSLKPSSSVTSQTKTVTPSTVQQVIVPDETVDYLTQVTVAAIPYAETSNSAGGTTITIG